ncbi:hypothetical protein ASPCAL14784 [Aspergillus calidoustus]|uniref:Uncharacterized protein n=1 Tax=Aspergillus calidoustus TaxID=454130 RepID=A0A0U5HBT9_ASPCI|nr:hypothetical protein ASPCAL14784 [Aspergillus calidoustus]
MAYTLGLAAIPADSASLESHYPPIKWMCIIAIAPEFGVTMAADEFWQAWKLTGRVGSPGFTVTHAFYALMGGFLIGVPVQNDGDTQLNEAEIQAATTESGQARSKRQNLGYHRHHPETVSKT